MPTVSELPAGAAGWVRPAALATVAGVPSIDRQAEVMTQWDEASIVLIERSDADRLVILSHYLMPAPPDAPEGADPARYEPIKHPRQRRHKDGSLTVNSEPGPALPAPAAHAETAAPDPAPESDLAPEPEQ